MNVRLRSWLIYAAKCVTGTLAVYTIAHFIHYNDITWALISVVLVLSADGKDSLFLAFTRIKANVVGGVVGVLVLNLAAVNMWSVSLALAVAMALCYLLKLDAGIRSAMAAVIIIMLYEEGKHHWNTAVERMFGVLAGCFIGLVVTYLFHYKERLRVNSSANPSSDA